MCFFPSNVMDCNSQIGAPEGGKYQVVLSSDAERFGGKGRIGVGIDHFTHPEGVPGEALWFMLACWAVEGRLNMHVDWEQKGPHASGKKET